MSSLEESLTWALIHLAPDLTGWQRQYRLPESARRFAWDFAFPTSRLLIDVEGGFYAKGRSAHSGASIERDLEKGNIATCAGYRTLRFGPKDCSRRALADTMDVIRAALMAKAPPPPHD